MLIYLISEKWVKVKNMFLKFWFAIFFCWKKLKHFLRWRIYQRRCYNYQPSVAGRHTNYHLSLISLYKCNVCMQICIAMCAMKDASRWLSVNVCVCVRVREYVAHSMRANWDYWNNSVILLQVLGVQWVCGG